MSKPIPTNRQALKAAELLHAYYKELGRRMVLDPFCDRMVASLSHEIDAIPKRSPLTR